MGVLKYILLLCVIAFGFIANPLVLNATEIEIVEVPVDACKVGELDAQKDVDGALWYYAGCLFGPLGVVVANISEPSPPAPRLIGKSPEYVASYTDCYKLAAKRIQGKYAFQGCVLVSVSLYLPLLLIYLLLTGCAY